MIHYKYNREFKYYDKDLDKVDMVNYIKTVMANNFIEEIYYLFLKCPQQFNQALNEIEYIYSKKLGSFVYPPKNYESYINGLEFLKKINFKEVV